MDTAYRNTSSKVLGTAARVVVVVAVISNAYSWNSDAQKQNGNAPLSLADRFLEHGCQQLIEKMKQDMDPNDPEYAATLKGYSDDCMNIVHKEQSSSDRAAPVSSPAALSPEKEQYKTSCLNEMIAFAKQNRYDPDRYIEVNQAYLQECINYKDTHNASDKKAP